MPERNSMKVPRWRVEEWGVMGTRYVMFVFIMGADIER